MIKPLKQAMWNAVSYKDEFHTKIHCFYLWLMIGIIK